MFSGGGVYWLNLRGTPQLGFFTIYWMEMDLTLLFDYEIQAIEMTEVALRSRQVAAASGSDLCSQVAALD